MTVPGTVTVRDWLNEPGVVRWSEGEDVSMSAVINDYGSARADIETNVVFGLHRDWTQAAAGPSTENTASCRALEKAGFDFAGSVQHPDDGGPCSLMILSRV